MAGTAFSHLGVVERAQLCAVAYASVTPLTVHPFATVKQVGEPHPGFGIDSFLGEPVSVELGVALLARGANLVAFGTKPLRHFRFGVARQAALLFHQGDVCRASGAPLGLVT